MSNVVRRGWPVAIFILVILANTDAAIVNQGWFCEHLHLSLVGLATMLIIVSLAEMAYEYWFFGWCGRQAASQAHDIWPRILDALKTRAQSQDVSHQFDGAMTMADRAWERIRDVGEVLAEGLDWRGHPTVKKGGYTALTVLSLPPIPGRTVAVGIQRAARLPGGLVLIGICSTVRVIYMLLGLNLITRFVSVRTLTLIALLAGLVWLWHKVQQKRRSRKDRT